MWQLGNCHTEQIPRGHTSQVINLTLIAHSIQELSRKQKVTAPAAEAAGTEDMENETENNRLEAEGLAKKQVVCMEVLQ